MYSNVPRTALRFSKVKPSYNIAAAFDLQCLSTVSETYLLPFQIRRPRRVDNVTIFKLVNLTETNETDLLTVVTSGDEPRIYTFEESQRGENIDVIVYDANEITSALNGGRYYVVVSDGVDTWYSMSVISIGCNSEGYINPVPVPIISYEDDSIDTDSNNQLIL